MYPRLFCSKRFTRPEARAKRSLFAHLMVDKDKEKFGWTISERLLLSAAVNAHQTNWFVVSRALRNHDLTKARLADENFFSAEKCQRVWEKISKDGSLAAPAVYEKLKKKRLAELKLQIKSFDKTIARCEKDILKIDDEEQRQKLDAEREARRKIEEAEREARRKAEEAERERRRLAEEAEQKRKAEEAERERKRKEEAERELKRKVEEQAAAAQRAARAAAERAAAAHALPMSPGSPSPSPFSSFPINPPVEQHMTYPPQPDMNRAWQGRRGRKSDPGVALPGTFDFKLEETPQFHQVHAGPPMPMQVPHMPPMPPMPMTPSPAPAPYQKGFKKGARTPRTPGAPPSHDERSESAMASEEHPRGRKRKLSEDHPPAPTLPLEEKESPAAPIPTSGVPRPADPATQAKYLEVIRNLKKNITSEWFRDAVDPNEVPDYYQVIKNPMYLTLMETMIKDGRIATLDDMMGNFQLIRDNAHFYNPPEHPVSIDADKFLKVCRRYTESLREEEVKRLAKLELRGVADVAVQPTKRRRVASTKGRFSGFGESDDD